MNFKIVIIIEIYAKYHLIFTQQKSSITQLVEWLQNSYQKGLLLSKKKRASGHQSRASIYVGRAKKRD